MFSDKINKKELTKLQTLPIGVQDFVQLRRDNLLYVDKTAKLLELIENGRRYFLSRPRRFGKSLTLSTLGAMFEGRKELFKSLAAEQWVTQQAEKPFPVLRLDMSSLGSYRDREGLNQNLVQRLEEIAEDNDLELKTAADCEGMLRQLIRSAFKRGGSVVFLIDEYDKPILDNLLDLKRAEEMREVLRSFYAVLKSCDEYLRFVFITGISKFSKMGVFSAMNNLQDISASHIYSDIVGYTQNELEYYFSDRIEALAQSMSITKDELNNKIRKYYDGFSFDGSVRLYNPFSILNFFFDGTFKNYWYTSGSPTFIVRYMKQHQINDPEEYRHIEVYSDFADTHEIEYSTPESFLYQSGYLTIEKCRGDTLTLDYPNEEVRKSLVRMYLDEIYHVKRYITLGTQLWEALSNGNIAQAVELYNTAIAGVPYDDFPKRNEYWYRSLFIMLLKGAGIVSYAEVHTFRGRCDLLIQFKDLIIVLEFKFSEKSSQVEKKLNEGIQQMNTRDYSKSYVSERHRVITQILVADDEKRQIVIQE